MMLNVCAMSFIVLHSGAKPFVCMTLAERATHFPSQLSGGEQQRVAIARALAPTPKLILADEPTGNLDPDSRSLVLSALADCHREGRTIVVVTHDPVAAQQAQRSLCLRDGKLSTPPDVSVAQPE